MGTETDRSQSAAPSIPINKSVGIDKFTRYHPRRLQMANILED